MLKGIQLFIAWERVTGEMDLRVIIDNKFNGFIVGEDSIYELISAVLTVSCPGHGLLVKGGECDFISAEKADIVTVYLLVDIEEGGDYLLELKGV